MTVRECELPQTPDHLNKNILIINSAISPVPLFEVYEPVNQFSGDQPEVVSAVAGGPLPPVPAERGAAARELPICY